MSKDLEEALRPITSNYVNIGGSIGYNFTYLLNDPYTSAKGTVTLSPRHSLLYLPFSLLIGVRDRFFVNIFTQKKLRGESHLVEASYLKKANITGIDSMQRREVAKGEKSFVLLWKGTDLSSNLQTILDALPEPVRLRHFCSFPENKTFFIHESPWNGQVKGNMEAILKHLPGFFGKEKEQA